MKSLSIVVCSRDRAGPLQRCLAALPSDSMRESGAELVVVDNGSRDATRDVVRDFAARATFPVVLVDEPRAGLSNARNRGLLAASGDVIAFTDDDCVLADDYPQRAARVFAGQAFRYCGGRILLGDPSDARYCFLDDPVPRRIAVGAALVPGAIQGANMVIHREVVERIGGFDPMLGAGTPFRAEDVDYLARASIAGFAGAYVPELVVHHYHGRKPGAALRAIKRDNDIARGAFFAKLIDMGRGEYARLWWRAALRPWKLSSTLRVGRGARLYRRAMRTAGAAPQLYVSLGGDRSSAGAPESAERTICDAAPKNSAT